MFVDSRQLVEAEGEMSKAGSSAHWKGELKAGRFFLFEIAVTH
jgi:hypothetical protein